MSTVSEIEAAIEKLTPEQVEELARWIDEVRARRGTPRAMSEWLARAEGAATAGVTTESVLAMTRGEE